jgi:hypothetical protein
LFSNVPSIYLFKVANAGSFMTHRECEIALVYKMQCVNYQAIIGKMCMYITALHFKVGNIVNFLNIKAKRK